MPALYSRILPEKPDTAWDFSRWVPDAVVINLDTNDFGSGIPTVFSPSLPPGLSGASRPG